MQTVDRQGRKTTGPWVGALLGGLAAVAAAGPAETASQASAPAPTFTLQQTLSDEAQRNTIAFDSLAFLTGSLGADSFFPPGKVADFWGFQHLRDNDPTEMGHNTDFLTRAADNVLYVLSDGQRAQLVDLAERQVGAINDYGMRRFPLMDAFRRLLAGDLPRGAAGLDREAVRAYSAELYRLDGRISYERAEVMGRIVRSLDTRQRQYLDGLVGRGMRTWPDPGEQLDKRGMSHDAHVAVMTYAGDLLAWYAGSVEADTYFCPERQGTYFGSFYLKDAPAMGNPNYSIDTNLTANMGRSLLAALDPSQARLVSGLVDAQRPYLYELVDVRRAIATELRRFTTGEAGDEAAVLRLAQRYGELDGEIVYSYATAFAAVGQSLTPQQQASLTALRRQLGDYTPKGAFLYSDPIDMPVIGSTDFLFGAGTGSPTSAAFAAGAATTGASSPQAQATAGSSVVGCAPAACASPIVDTGQTKSYDAGSEIPAPAPGQRFYGQDAQVSGSQPSYTLSGDGRTVFDNVTQLTWMRGPNTTLATPVKADKKTPRQAQAWVAAVNATRYGGFSDWRLPTIEELYSLMSFAGTDPSSYTGTDTSVLTPFVDTRYFLFAYGQTSQGERVIDSQYASSTLFVVNPAETGSPKLFGLNLADGRIKGYDLLMPDGRTEKTFFVQLVRGPSGYGVNGFVDNGDGTVTDAATGLMWSRADSGSGMTWEAALAWVQARNAASHLGHRDWRLPNAKELHSLVDYANAPDFNGLPAIDTAFFDSTPITNENGERDYPYYWTSTTHAGYSASGSAGGQAVYIPFGRALGWPDGAGRWVDVHGAGCQRSDPKVGPPFAFATARTVTRNGAIYTGYAHGPQGDAIRGLNFARLVRDSRV